MVAYSFKARFAGPILAGMKAQTIRADRRRHARPGEQLQLYTGMRTKRCRLIARVTCLDVTPVRLCFSRHGAAELMEFGGAFLTPASMERFAQADGFASVADMAAFWFEQHRRDGDEIDFRGVVIAWAAVGPDGGARCLAEAVEQAAGVAS